jgi:hypothetical protein
MDLIAGYGSDSEEDVNVAPAKPQTAPVSTVPRKPVPVAHPTKTKTKVFDISFLPPEIQAALARGDTAGDSDDDDAGLPTASRTSTGSAEVKRVPMGANSCKLLTMLPAPSTSISTDFVAEKPAHHLSGIEDRADRNNIKLNGITKDGDESVDPAPAVNVPPPKKSSFSFGYSTETTRKGVEQPFTGKSAAASSGSSSSAPPVMPWFQEDKKPLPEVFVVLYLSPV